MAKKAKFTIVKQKPNCILSVRLMFVISKMFGCNLFHLPKNRHSIEPIKMRAIDSAIVLTYVVLYSVFTLPFLIQLIHVRTSLLQSSGSFILVQIGRIILCLVVIANLTCYVIDAFNKTKIWKLLTNLYDFDEEAKLLGVTVENNNKFLLLYSARLIVTQVTVIGICGFLLHKQFESYWLILQFYISYVMMDGCYTSIFSVYNYFMYEIRKRFNVINDTLSDLLNVQCITRNRLTTSCHLPTAESEQIKVIVSLAKLYQKLSNSIRILNECYSVQVSLIIAIVFQFTLVSSFMTYRIFVGKYNLNTLLVTIAYFVRTIYFYSQTMIAIFYGSSISSEAKYTNYILNKGLNLSLNESVLNQLEQFLLQINHSLVTVSCGLFSMDWTLFYTMTAAIASYLVLFIQFDTLVTSTKLE